MIQRLRLLFGLLLLSGILFPDSVLWAQTFTGTPAKITSDVLQTQFKHCEIYQIDVAALDVAIKNNPTFSEQELLLGSHQWKLQLTPSEITGSGYTLQVLTPQGLQTTYPTENKAFKGYESQGGGKVRLTVDDNFIYGFIDAEGGRYYIEPLSYYEPGAAHDLFVVYEREAVKPDTDHICGAEEEQEKADKWIESYETSGDDDASKSLLACYQIEIAIASDNSMFNKYGSVTAVENHNIAVLNDVQGDYTGNFNHDIEFTIVTQFVVVGADPWSASLDPGTLLGSFRTWGNAGNFGVPFDIAELWTNRNFSGNVIGIAYINGVCNTNKYHCLQDYTASANSLRSLTSHEIGHNFNCPHDPQNTNFIMSPVNVGSMTWSANSINVISSYITTKINSGCLSPCGPPPPPLVADFDWNPSPACQGAPVQMSDQSSGNITGRSWTFQNGIPSTSNQTNPVVTWNNPGTYNVTLTLNGNGGPVSTTKQVTVLGTPVANFSFTVDGLTVNFNNLSANADSYLWEFGDGGISDEQNPSYTYIDPGLYIVKLTVTNGCGMAMKTIPVNTAPVAEFSANPTTGCAPMSVHFVNESSPNAVSYVWQFPGGSPVASGLQNPTVIYQNPGAYSVTLTAINPSGSSTVIKSNYIIVQANPVSNFISAINGQVVTFTNTSQNATSYLWNFGDGMTSTDANPVHTYTTGGTYTVMLTATNDCGSVTVSQTVTVNAPPAAAFTASPTSGCGPLTVQFTNQSSGNPTAYNWQFAGGTPSSSTAQNPSVVYNTPGTYSVTLTVSNAAGSNTLTQTNYITVNTVPAAGFTNSVNGVNATFTNTSQNAVSYSWTFGDGGTSNQANPTHTYATDGVYTVVLTASNPCGTSTATQTVTIVTPPTAGFSASPTSGCGPLTVQFTNSSSLNATAWNWQFPGGSPSSSAVQNPVVVYNTPGTYSVTLTVSNAAGSNTASQTNYITVNTVPVAGFTNSVNGLNATFTNTSQNAVSYSWTFGDGGTSNLANPTHTYTTDGVYTVVLTATNPCGNTTATQTVTIVTPPTAGFTASPTSGCGPLTVQFTNSSSLNATAWNWQFPGGSPSSATVQNPVVVYNTPGTYSVTLTASNAAGSNTATQTNYITVNPAPSPAFTSSVNGSTATFTNTSQNAVSYSWAFGDGGTSNLANPTHTYAGDGTYTVTLTATNPCGSTTFTQNVIIITEPTAGFTANTTTGCAALTVNFQDLSSGNTTSWAWSFPGGTPSSSTQQNPTVVYNTPGTYDVTLVATSPGGSSTYTQQGFITVLAPPSASFSSTVNGATASFTNGSVNAMTYNWAFGDGSTSSMQNPGHTYLEDGTYTVTLTAINNCGSTTFTQTVTIVTAPNAAFTVNNTAGCTPFAVQFSNQSSPNATTFNWTFAGAQPGASNLENPSATWDTPGTYQVTLIASNAAGSDTTTMMITANGIPDAGFTVQTAGLSVVLTNTSQNATSYFWDFGDGGTSNLANPTYTYSATGMYVVSLTATNACGTDQITTTVTIAGSAPIAAIGVSENSGCAPFTVTYTDQSAGNPTDWKWEFPGGVPGNSTQQNPTVTYSTPGSYTATLIVTNQYGSDTITTSNPIIVQNVPVTAFGFVINQGAVTFNNQSQNATAYQWNFGDASSSSEANPTHVYAAPGTYTVELTAVNNCGANTLQQMIVITTVGTETPEWLEYFSLYPNPNAGAFHVEMNGQPQEEVEFVLYDALGRLVRRDVSDFGSGSLNRLLDYGQLSAAVYQLHIRAGNTAMVVKIVVQH